MAQTIKIKRSTSTVSPSTLAAGELAYSFKTDTKKLYIGDGSSVHAIGGQSFTDKLDGIESAATADQTNAEIKAAVEAASDSNTFTDADHSKLNGIEASADVTDATNVAAAGALMTSGGSLTGNLDVGGTLEFDGLKGTGSVTVTTILDEDNMLLNSNTALATQQSIKAYVDNNTADLGNFTFSGDEISSSGSTMVLDPSTDGVGGVVEIHGSLTVTGTTTTVNSTTIDLGDTLINLNSNQDESSAPPSSLIAGITVDRGSETYDAHIMYKESTNTWRVATGGNYDYELLTTFNFETAVTTLDGGTF